MQLLRIFLTGITPLTAVSAEVTPRFESQTIDDKIAIGYGLALGDMDGDGRQDILLADAREFVWYQNPTWEKHVFAKLSGTRDNVCIAAQDIDGDGKVEVAVGANWNPGETSDEAQSGSVHYLIRPKEAGALWKAVELPHEPTVHRMRWVELSKGQWSLVVLPLHGRGNRDGAGDNHVKIQAYHPGKDPADAQSWRIETLDESMHVTHNLDVLPTAEHALLIGGKEGLLIPPNTRPVLKDAKDSPLPLRPFTGVGELRWMDADSIAAIEPFHGNLLTFYVKGKDAGSWERGLLDDQLAQGHALGCADFMGTHSAQIVAGWREPNAAGKLGIKLYWKSDQGNWTHAWIDENHMACEDLKIADLNGDGQPDIIASGRSTKNVVIYWNRTAAK